MDLNLNLPIGWKRYYTQRKNGLSAGKYDFYIISSDGTRFRSKNEILKYLEKNGKMAENENFDFNFVKKNFILETANDEALSSNQLSVSINSKKVSKKDKKRNSEPGIIKKFEANDINVTKENLVEDVLVTKKRKRKTSDEDEKMPTKKQQRASLPNYSSSKKNKNSKFCISMNFLSKPLNKLNNHIDAVNIASKDDNIELNNRTDNIASKDDNTELFEGLETKMDKCLDDVTCATQKCEEIDIAINTQSEANNFTLIKEKKTHVKKNKKSISTIKNIDSIKTEVISKQKNTPDTASLPICQPILSPYQPILSPYQIFEEVLYKNQWKLFVFSILKENIKSDLDIIHEDLNIFFNLIPDASCCTLQKITEAFNLMEIKFHEKCVDNLIQLSYDYINKTWSCPSELNGITQSAIDAYNIFCLGDWMKVNTQDDDLNKYTRWLWENMF